MTRRSTQQKESTVARRKVGQLWIVSGETYYDGKCYVLLEKIKYTSGVHWKVLVAGEDDKIVVWQADEMKNDKLISDAI